MNLTMISLGANALLALGLLLQWQTGRTDHAQMQAKVTTAETARDSWKLVAQVNDDGKRTAAAANLSLQGAVHALQLELVATQAITAQAQADGARALRELQTARQNLRAAAAREAEIRGQVYATDPLCAAWAATPVCPAIADRLRAAARGGAPP